MRITDDRYRRERAHHDLALRMIAHEARTCTIRVFTHLSEDRVRKLYRSCVGQHSHVRRRRGKSPRQVEYFTRNVGALFEASVLAAVFAAHGLMRAGQAVELCPSLQTGTRLCDAFENHCRLFPRERMSFEHAWCLLTLLSTRRELTLQRCPQCHCEHIADPVIPSKYGCAPCKIRQTPLDQLPSVLARLAEPSEP